MQLSPIEMLRLSLQGENIQAPRAAIRTRGNEALSSKVPQDSLAMLPYVHLADSAPRVCPYPCRFSEWL